MKKLRTPEYQAARVRRVARLSQTIGDGTYRLPDGSEVAECILFGRCAFGEAVIDDEGNRIDHNAAESSPRA